MKKLFNGIFLFVLLFFIVSSFGCSRSSRAIQIKGSDTMVNMAQLLAERFMVVHPEIPIAITGGGTGVGIAALINRNADIAICSRDMKAKEIKTAEEKNVEPNEIVVANDGIAVIVSPKNPINKIDENTLSDIYSGKTTNWSELGGPKENIVVLSRDRNSGTHIFFLEHIVKLGDKKNPNEFAKQVLMMPSTQAIVEEVSSNPQAIGYIGLGYLNDKVKAIAVAKDKKSKYVYPSVETASDLTYPISRPLYFYTDGKPEGKAKEFIDYVFSKDGQKVVVETGFVPLTKK